MITREKAQMLAYDWHGGGGSPLYQFASLGGHVLDADHRRRLIAEIRDAQHGEPDPTNRRDLFALRTYITKAPVSHPANMSRRNGRWMFA